MARGHTRVTLVGGQRRVDVVLPSDEPVGQLLAEAVVMVGELADHPPEARRLATRDGTLLRHDDSLRDAGVMDGSVLRIVGSADAPPPAVVHDITDETADDLDRHVWLWGAGSRRWFCTAVVVLAVGLAARVLTGDAPSVGQRAVLMSVAVVLLTGGAAVARVAHRPAGVAFLLSGAAVGALGAGVFGQPLGVSVVGVAAVTSVTAIALGLGSDVGRGGVIGGALGLALTGGWATLLGGGTPWPRTAALLAVVSVALLGVLPRIALTASGLSALDDRRSRGEEVIRPAAANALAGAHRGLTLAVIAAAASAAAAGVALALGTPTSWTVTMGCLVAAALAVRARVFPLTPQVVAVAAAAAVVLVALLAAWSRASAGSDLHAATVLIAVAGVAALALVTQPPEHVRARLRKFGDRAEAVTVIAMVPVTVGLFGVYGSLLKTF